MASTKTANAIGLTSSLTKLYFIGWDAPLLTGLTTVTINETSYDVVEISPSNDSWLIIGEGADAFESRVEVTADFPSGGGTEIPLGYGLLYNWYAATDARGVAPSGFRIPSVSDYVALINSLGAMTAAGQVKSTRVLSDGEPYWSDPNTGASNSSELSFFAAGERDAFDGSYSNLHDEALLITTNEVSVNFQSYSLNNTSAAFAGSLDGKAAGASVRCVSDTEPSSDTVTDNDGNEYTWVQIGSQYWLQQNLKTQTFNNGDSIPTGFNNTDWSNLTTAGWAYPNGDSSLPI
jgi:uncharacterized protein (TIGR02145 family)